jgi:DNA-directed RNA polymerase I subunit RPA1
VWRLLTVENVTKGEVKRGFVSFIRELLKAIKKYLGSKKKTHEPEAVEDGLAEDEDKQGQLEKKYKKKNIDSDVREGDLKKKKDTFSDDSEQEDEEEPDEDAKPEVVEEDDVAYDEEKDLISQEIGEFGVLTAKNLKTGFHVQCKFLHKEHLFFSHFVELASKKTFLRSIAGIDRVILNEKDSNFSFTINGNNFDEIYKLDPKLVDFDNILTNDVNKTVSQYGIEAGRALIIKDAQSVFSMYGIPVNERHIALIADYMTFLGFYKACNRHALVFRPGPWHKMTFEQSTKFLMDAVVNGETDPVTGPSSRIIFGRLTDQGTGSFDLRVDLAE